MEYLMSNEVGFSLNLWCEWTSQGMKNGVPCGKLATTKATHPEI